MLAISLHATNDELRDKLVPHQPQVSDRRAAGRAAAPIRACRTPSRMTFEYVMLKGVNDSPADARRLVQLLGGHPGEDQPDPVQPLARDAPTMLGLETIERFAAIAQPRRLRLADPHAARARHPRRLRPAALGQHNVRRGSGAPRARRARMPCPVAAFC